VRRVVPRRARSDVVSFTPGVSAGQNGVGVEVLKGPQRLAARVPGRQQQAWREPVPVRSTATDGDAHEVAVPHGLEVQTPKPDFESDREGVRAAHGVPLAPILGADHHRDGCREADLQRKAPYVARQLSGFFTACSKFLSIVRRARMVSAEDNRIYTTSGL
jgi:hypothetical protein